ncbi:MAG: hypothetical protein ACOZB3_09450 [Calditrichota bacterium]
MGNAIHEIKELLNSKIKPKEKTIRLSELLQNDTQLIAEMLENFRHFTASEQGTCLSALTIIAQDNPKSLGTHLDFIIARLGDKPPRVKWEAGEIVGYLAREFPQQVTPAIPALLANTREDGTVVRWSAAFALTEIAKYNSQSHRQLVPFFKKSADTETGGVKTLYVKALKQLAKAAG